MPTQKNHLPIWPICLVLAVILQLSALNPVCRYFYTKDFVTRSDIQTAELFADDIETKGLTGSLKPIFFFGSAGTRTNASCLDLSTGKYDIFSVFDAGNILELDTLETSQYIIDYLNGLGYDYTSPTKEDWDNYKSEMAEFMPLEKTFPWYAGILETEHCIIVQLS